MIRLASSPSDRLNRFLKFCSEVRFHDLEIICRGGEIVTSTTLLIAALLPPDVEKELALTKEVG